MEPYSYWTYVANFVLHVTDTDTQEWTPNLFEWIATTFGGLGKHDGDKDNHTTGSDIVNINNRGA